MFSKVLIGIDGGDGGLDALALGRSLAAPDAELVLAHIWEPVAGIVAAATGEPHPARLAEELLDAAARGLTGRYRTVARPASSPGAGLHALAEQFGCDLLVVGSASAQRTGRVHLTRDVRMALHGAPCAVAVAPAGHRTARTSIERVGLGFEETDLCEQALVSARGLAADLGAELWVETVVPLVPSAWFGGPFTYLALFDDIVGRTVEEARERLEARGGLKVSIARGAAAPSLLEFSSRVDLLVLGSRAYGPARRMLLGSTSDAVVRDAACPVLILPLPVLADTGAHEAATASEPVAAGAS